MAHVTDAQLEAAEARGRELAARQPRALSARYDAARGRIILELSNGCAYAFPSELAQELQGAGPEALAELEIDGAGFNIHWPRLDVDLHVPALIAGVFGTRAWTVGRGSGEPQLRTDRASA